MRGQLLGHYRVLELIGAGGMGEVYRARDERLGRDVALKIVRPSSSKDTDRIRRFEREARAAAALNHPNIVSIFDIGLHDGMPFIVSELLEGNTLREHLSGGTLSVKEAVDYGLQIAAGLMAAHEKHIVHRDLKPENLFITRDNRIKILDFGIAKLIHPEAITESSSMVSMTTQTRTGSVLGTVAYMSPEQLRGKPIDARSDIFSLGTILYEMLAGRRAFRGETDVDTMTAVLRETPPDLTHERASIPLAFEQIVNHCLEKEPEKRFQSVSDLCFALETLTPPRPPSPPWASVLQKAAIVAMAVGVLVAAIWLLLHAASARPVVNPDFHRLTFELGTVYSARFAPGGRRVVYEASWNGHPPQLYATVSDAPQAQALDLPRAHLLALSRSNELALQINGSHGTFLDYTGGTLARAPLAGGSPRELLEDVRWADWNSDSKLAIVHHGNGRSRLEFPEGHVLYESAGWISHIRFSPDGQRIAFMDHPVLWDDRGFVRVIDLQGHATTISGEWESESGLAWNGNEVWFTAVQAGYNRKLRASTLSGQNRLVLSVPEGLNLQDIAPDGRVLVFNESQRVVLEALEPGDSEPRDLSWYDWSVAKDISQDGQWLLFEESSEPFAGNYAVAARTMNGSPPIHLGDGSAGGLSPDGKWALDISMSGPPRVTLLPIGPGQAHDIPLVGIEHVQNGSARFMPDGQDIIFNANEPGRPVRGYMVALEGGKPRPVTPEGLPAFRISPDSRFVVAQGPGAPFLCSLDTSALRVIPGLLPGENVAQWSADSSAIYVYRFGDSPVKVFRVDIVTGKRTLIRELRPLERSGVISIGPVTMSQDASRFAYSYYQNTGTLYVISGLK